MEMIKQPTPPITLFIYRPGEHFSIEAADRILSPSGQAKRTDQPIPLAAPDPRYFKQTEDPGEADFIVYPFDLGGLIYRCGLYGNHPILVNDPRGEERLLDFLSGLPFFRHDEAKHLFIASHDWAGPRQLKSLYFNPSVNIYRSSPAAMPLPFFTADVAEEMKACAGGATMRHHASFVGGVGTHTARVKMVRAILDSPLVPGKLNIHLDLVQFFHHAIQQPEVKKARRISYLRVLAESITVLCPRGSGTGTSRMFEAMAASRIPVVISDAYQFPLADGIDWDALVLRIPEKEVNTLPDRLLDWFNHTPRATLARMAYANRIIWQEHFHPSKQQEYLARCMRKFLATGLENEARGELSPPINPPSGRLSTP